MKTSDHELRLSDTNSASDSEGKTWGLDGDLFWYLVGGVFAFVITLLLLFSAFGIGFTQSLLVAAVPLILKLVYVFGFRQGKPPGYDVDLMDTWTSGKGFAPVAENSAKHPLLSDHVAD